MYLKWRYNTESSEMIYMPKAQYQKIIESVGEWIWASFLQEKEMEIPSI